MYFSNCLPQPNNTIPTPASRLHISGTASCCHGRRAISGCGAWVARMHPVNLTEEVIRQAGQQRRAHLLPELIQAGGTNDRGGDQRVAHHPPDGHLGGRHARLLRQRAVRRHRLAHVGLGPVARLSLRVPAPVAVEARLGRPTSLQVLAREQAHGQWRVRGHGHALGRAHLRQAGVKGAAGERQRVGQHSHARQRAARRISCHDGAREAVGRLIAEPHRAHLARRHRAPQLAQLLLQRHRAAVRAARVVVGVAKHGHVPVRPVHVHHVQVVGAQPRQAAVDGGADVGGIHLVRASPDPSHLA
mmetsp:Transcript_35074/g.88800  ORF Transcript_35074/g.88800 Transcript_35074/m.88800 type:complete len:302 (-) Transcript_35074:428-1333(-)